MQPKKIHCPRCHKETEYSLENPHRPFCSSQCQIIDLGDWAQEKFRVPTSDFTTNDNPEDIDDILEKKEDSN